MKPTDANEPIKPEHIDTSQHFWDAFGKREKEVTAGWIVRFCQERGDWGPFQEAEITKFYRRKVRDEDADFYWDGLDDDGLISITDGVVTIGHSFTAACFKSSPKKD